MRIGKRERPAAEPPKKGRAADQAAPEVREQQRSRVGALGMRQEWLTNRYTPASEPGFVHSKFLGAQAWRNIASPSTPFKVLREAQHG